MKSLGPATFADSDPVQCPVQSIQGIEEGFRFGLSTLSPKTFSHFIHGLDGALYFSSGCCAGVCRPFLGHCQNFCSACTKKGGREKSEKKRGGVIFQKGTEK
jgi:hypothetical protein